MRDEGSYRGFVHSYLYPHNPLHWRLMSSSPAGIGRSFFVSFFLFRAIIDTVPLIGSGFLNSQKRVTLAACALFIMLGFLSGGISEMWDAKTQKAADDEKRIATFSPADSASEALPKFTLTIRDGVVVVFNEIDEMRPIIITDIYASTLRHFDRERLSDGIEVFGELELQSILEDFSS